MTQEQKELLLKDFYARLPYDIKFPITVPNPITSEPIETIGTISSINRYGIVSFVWNYEGQEILEKDAIHIKDVKPYLFPLSSMTVEQRCKAQNLLPNKCEISFINSKITYYGEDCCEIKLEQFDKLFKFFDSQHVDYRGLIPMGLAIDATGLNIY